MTLRSLAHRILQKFDPHAPLVEVGISRAALLHNLAAYRTRYPDLAFAPVLKSNAYGHGLATIAKLLDTQGMEFFMVDSYYEARTLRAAGIRTRIVIIGYVQPKEILHTHLRDVDFAIIDIEQLREVATRAKRSLRLHIKLDSGMHRQGILPEQLAEAIELLHANPRLEVVGICSHFADAESADRTNTDIQIARWNDMRKTMLVAFPSIQHIHFAATKGIKRAEEIGVNVVRLGIGLYGFDTSLEGDMSLQPVLELRSLISSLRSIPAGEFVGYNALYRATGKRTIATVPLGYYEGIDRDVSNSGSMQVRGKVAPIAGRVSMNMSSIDVTDIPEARRGDCVVGISRHHEDPNSVRAMAKLAGTTPYVILVHIPQHLKRVVE